MRNKNQKHAAGMALFTSTARTDGTLGVAVNSARTAGQAQSLRVSGASMSKTQLATTNNGKVFLDQEAQSIGQKKAQNKISGTRTQTTAGPRSNAPSSILQRFPTALTGGSAQRSSIPSGGSAGAASRPIAATPSPAISLPSTYTGPILRTQTSEEHQSLQKMLTLPPKSPERIRTRKISLVSQSVADSKQQPTNNSQRTHVKNIKSANTQSSFANQAITMVRSNKQSL